MTVSRSVLPYKVDALLTRLHSSEQPTVVVGANEKPTAMGIKPSEMSTEALWAFHEEVWTELIRKVILERARLDDHLTKFNSRHAPHRYPKLLPKYRNPKQPNKLWFGRGTQPRWLAPELRSRKALDDFLVPLD